MQKMNHRVSESLCGAASSRHDAVAACPGDGASGGGVVLGAAPAIRKSFQIAKVSLLCLAALAAVACSRPATLASDADKPVQRYDVMQAVAANDKVVVAGTQNGSLLVSTDFGRDWKRQHLANDSSLLDLTSCPDGSFIGIDFNHRIWSGSADGATWQAHNIESPRIPLTVACDVNGRWYVAGTRSKLAMSPDHGATWQVTDLGEDAQITALQMVDGEHGYALGEFGIFATTSDGGASWQAGESLPGEFYPYAALFVSREVGYASGLAGTILRTEDGGASWQKIENTAQAALYRLFLHEGKPYGAGAAGVVARLEGDAFVSLPYPDVVPVFLGAAASIPGRQEIVVGGPGGLIRHVGTKVN